MLIVGNWKAYIDSKEDAKKLYALVKRLSVKARKHRFVVAPPAPYLGLLSSGTRSKVVLASQDISARAGGAATGEVTAAALRSLGASYAIVGHSERRAAGEDDLQIAEKAKRALASGLTPILCIGERERDADARYLAFLKGQIAAVFGALSPKERMGVVIAYEPIFAIGKSAADAMAPADVAEMILYIRKVLGEYLPGRGAQKTAILYGGSVEPGNARALAGESGVQGFLVGHASADPAMFAALVKALG